VTSASLSHWLLQTRGYDFNDELEAICNVVPIKHGFHWLSLSSDASGIGGIEP